MFLVYLLPGPGKSSLHVNVFSLPTPRARKMEFTCNFFSLPTPRARKIESPTILAAVRVLPQYKQFRDAHILFQEGIKNYYFPQTWGGGGSNPLSATKVVYFKLSLIQKKNNKKVSYKKEELIHIFPFSLRSLIIKIFLLFSKKIYIILINVMKGIKWKIYTP